MAQVFDLANSCHTYARALQSVHSGQIYLPRPPGRSRIVTGSEYFVNSEYGRERSDCTGVGARHIELMGRERLIAAGIRRA